MPRYDFRSPGADAGNAIQQFLVQRKMEERQRMLDAAAMEKQNADIQRQSEAIAVQRQQVEESARLRELTQTGLDDERLFRRATTIAGNALPGDPVDEQTAAMLSEQGYGGQVQTVPGVISQGPMVEAESAENDYIPTYGVNQAPDQSVMRGGSRFLSARATEAARAEQAAATAAASAERSEASNQTRVDIASFAAQGQRETGALRNELLQTQVDTANQKQEDARLAGERARVGELDFANGVMTELDRLMVVDESGAFRLNDNTKKVVGGARVPAPIARLGLPGMSDQSDAIFAIDSLLAKMDINTLRELKAQSRTGATGFGALSERELSVLENAAAMLKTAQSEGTYLERLMEIRGAMEKVISFSSMKPDRIRGDGSAPPPSSGGFRVLGLR